LSSEGVGDGLTGCTTETLRNCLEYEDGNIQSSNNLLLETSHNLNTPKFLQLVPLL